MNNSPLVSVIIPSYNHEKYIEESILSVLNQSYKNLELIVIDDGSKDNSVDVIKNMQIKYNFKFISQMNKGVCKTLNKGVCLSNGKYIAVLASDDYWYDKKIEEQVQLLEKNENNAEFCYTKAVEFSSNKKNRVFPIIMKIGNVLNSIVIKDFVPAGSMMFTRKLFDKLEGFDETLVAEDWDFVIRAAANTNFIAVNKPYLYYRAHETNTMRITPRKEIFRQKVVILLKNYQLMSPFRWFISVSIHFLHDIILKKGQ